MGSALAAAALTWLVLTKLENLFLPGVVTIFFLLAVKKPFWALIILLALPALGEYSRLEFLGRSVVLSDIFIPVFELTLLWSFRDKFIDPRLTKVIKTLLIFMVLAAFSLLLALLVLPFTDILQSGLYLFRLVLYFGLIPCSWLLIDPAREKPLQYWLIVIALCVAATGFLQLQFLPNLEDLAKTAGYDPHINRLVGSWLDPNFIGGYFAVVSVFFLSLAVYEKHNNTRLLLLGTSTVLLIALFLTYSRSAYLSFLVGIFILGIMKARTLLIVILIIGGIGLASSERAQQRVDELVTSMTSVLFNTAENPDPTARLRIQNWEQTLELIGQKPWFGHGYNTLSYVKLNEGFIKSEDVHSASGSDSSLLTITATTGIIGLLVFLFFIFLILRDSLLTWLHDQDHQHKAWGLGVFIVTLSLLVHSNFVNSLIFPQMMLFYLPLIGFFYRPPSKKTATPPPARKHS